MHTTPPPAPTPIPPHDTSQTVALTLTNRRRGAVAEALALLQLPRFAPPCADDTTALIEPACGLRPAHADLLSPVLDLLDHAACARIVIPSHRVSTRTWTLYQNLAWGRPTPLLSHLEPTHQTPALAIGLIAAWGLGTWRVTNLPPVPQLWILDAFSPWGRSGWPAQRGLVIAAHSLLALQTTWRWAASPRHPDPRTLGYSLIGDLPHHQRPTRTRPTPTPAPIPPPHASTASTRSASIQDSLT